MNTAEGVLEPSAAGTNSRERQLVNRLQQRLSSTRYPALAGVLVEERGGQIVMRGRVRSYYYKQLAQSIAMRADGVDSLRNEIEVS